MKKGERRDRRKKEERQKKGKTCWGTDCTAADPITSQRNPIIKQHNCLYSYTLRWGRVHTNNFIEGEAAMKLTDWLTDYNGSGWVWSGGKTPHLDLTDTRREAIPDNLLTETFVFLTSLTWQMPNSTLK
jgi:hypothetical protein